MTLECLEGLWFPLSFQVEENDAMVQNCKGNS